MYFAFEGDDIDAVLADVKRNDATGQPATATTGGLVDKLPILHSEKSSYYCFMTIIVKIR